MIEIFFNQTRGVSKLCWFSSSYHNVPYGYHFSPSTSYIALNSYAIEGKHKRLKDRPWGQALSFGLVIVIIIDLLKSTKGHVHPQVLSEVL